MEQTKRRVSLETSSLNKADNGFPSCTHLEALKKACNFTHITILYGLDRLDIMLYSTYFAEPHHSPGTW